MTQTITGKFGLQLAALAHEVDGEAPEWLWDLKRAAIARFEEHGFPNVHDEDWKYTDVSAISRGAIAPADAAPAAELAGRIAARLTELSVTGPRLVFINGRLSAELSNVSGLPSRVRLSSMSGQAGQGWLATETHLDDLAGEDASPFVALNTGLFRNGALIDFGNGVAVREAVHVVFVAVGSAERPAIYARTLIVLGTGAQATIAELYLSLDGATFTDAVSEIHVGPGSTLSHCRIVGAGETALHVGATEVALSRDASYRSLQLTAGNLLARADLNVRFFGEGAECVLNGAYVGHGSQHLDNHTLIDHAVANCTSRQLYKGIVADSASAVFNGKVIVRPGAQKTDAAQTNKNLLLSSTATVDTKPQLEILADDVRCTHGAAVGPPDDETLFYLQSRGLDVEEATGLLAYGFAADVLSGWTGSVRDLAENTLRAAVAAAVRTGIPV